MKLDQFSHIKELKAFLDGSQAIAFGITASKDERYEFVEKLLERFVYSSLCRKEKGIVQEFFQKVSGYSRAQLKRMISRYLREGHLKRYQRTSNGFERYYTVEDIHLLAELDSRHDTPNGMMVKKLCERAYYEFNDVAYKRLSGISVSHIYNLRQCTRYQTLRRHYTKTKPTKCAQIGTRRKPRANGKPGYIRVDTVHQGDLDGAKGVYHINAVDEVTQFEIVVSVEKISEAYLIPALNMLIDAFPFRVINFHSDNGSEYVNYRVAQLLEKLRIEFTKSRPRQSNDNALAEGKNAAVVRKIFGYAHIQQHHAKRINQFNQQALNPYINYHRPCLFPTTIIDKKGKQQKKYRYENMMTSYQKLKSLPNAKKFLNKGITFYKLDAIASQMTDNQAAEYMQKQRQLLFKHIHDNAKMSA